MAGRGGLVAPIPAAVYFAADDTGRRPVFRVDVQTGEVRQVTGDDGVYTDLNPSPDGRYLYALRSAVDSPPTPVRIELAAAAAAAARSRWRRRACR